ncbi:MAG TPA: ribonuclease E inhibitor RraB [Allosphingosinicella sp.]
MTRLSPEEKRLGEEWQADQDVLRSLRENGDNPVLARCIDVSFRASREALEKLVGCAGEYGLQVTQLVDLDRDESRLDTTIIQSTEDRAIRALTILALRIEAEHQVEYDGWGCVPETGSLQ